MQLARTAKIVAVALMAAMMITMALVIAVAAPAMAAKPTEKVTAGGWFISKDQPYVSHDLIGHECHFGVVGMMDANGDWRGQGSFMDKNDSIKAILTIEDGAVNPDGSLFVLYGTARVYVDHEYIGDYEFKMLLEDFVNADGDVFITVSMAIAMPGYTPHYFVWSHPYIEGGQVDTH
jgi:hypothetical protein